MSATQNDDQILDNVAVQAADCERRLAQQSREIKYLKQRLENLKAN